MIRAVNQIYRSQRRGKRDCPFEAILEDVRTMLGAEAEVHEETASAHFVGHGESSLDIQVLYFAADPNWARHLAATGTHQF